MESSQRNRLLHEGVGAEQTRAKQTRAVGGTIADAAWPVPISAVTVQRWRAKHERLTATRCGG